MARPRVFVSSTFIDLRQVRADIETFLNDIGYEPVLFERGTVPYAHDVPLEESAYSEVERCDILVAIIGSRFGTGSSSNNHSITQNEIRKAVELNKPIFVFCDRDVLSEYKTWYKNRDISGIKFAHADDVRVFEFMEHTFLMKKNNPVFSFGFASDIVITLREQFAGLFQDLLSKKTAAAAAELVSQLRQLTGDLENLIKRIAQGSADKTLAIEQLLMANHPVFSRLQKIEGIKYRVYFSNLTELDWWLEARRWKKVDEAFGWNEQYHEWTKEKSGRDLEILSVSSELFDESGNLKFISETNWDDSLIKFEIARNYKKSSKASLDDEIPF